MAFEYQKLRGRIVEKCGSQQALAEELGVSTTVLSMKLNNKIRFSSDDIINISRILDIDAEDIGSFFFAVKV